MSRKIPILVQLIVGFSAIIMIIMSFTSYITYQKSAQVVLEKTSQYIFESVNQALGKVDVFLREYDKLTQLLIFSGSIQEHFKTVNENGETVLTKYDVEKLLRDQTSIIGDDLIIALMDNQGGVYQKTETSEIIWNSEQDMKALPWYPLIDSYRGKMIWAGGSFWRYGPVSGVIGARQLKNRDTLEKMGVVVVAFPTRILQETVGRVHFGDNGKIQLVDQFAQIIYSTDSEDVGTQLEGKLQQQIQKGTGGVFLWEADQSERYIIHSQSEYSGWKIVAYIDPDDLLTDLNEVRKSTWMIGLSGIIAAVVFLGFFSWTLVRPIRKLAVRLTNLKQGESLEYRTKLANQEVAVLYESFNKMMANLDQTIQDLSEKQISEKQAQLVALRAQFQPHFLYNSLNTIYWAILGEGKTEKVANMVITLSDLLRYSIQTNGEFVTVQEDVDQLSRYLEICQVRYGSKLKAAIEIDPSLRSCRIMKLMLQPLVENAITHGLEMKKGNEWFVRVRGSLEDNTIHFVVEDNGLGMSNEKMEEVLLQGNQSNNPMHTGIGLSNLHYRIGLIYGKPYGIELSRSELGGLRIDIKVPNLSTKL